MKGEALYPFGYGLSYTDFAYVEVSWDTCVITDIGVTLRVPVKNIGSMAGGETVRAYVKIEGEDTPNAQLKGICKLHLAPGEEREAEIRLPAEAFGLYDKEGKLRIRNGRAKVFVGGQAPDRRSERLMGKKVTELSFEVTEL